MGNREGREDEHADQGEVRTHISIHICSHPQEAAIAKHMLEKETSGLGSLKSSLHNL